MATATLAAPPSTASGPLTGRLKQIALDGGGGTSDLFHLNPRDLTEAPNWNARHEGPELEAHIEQLKEDIRINGVKTPIRIYRDNGRVFYTDGFCRMRAVRRLLDEGVEVAPVPCIPEDKYAKEEDRIAMLITSNTGKPLTGLEIAGVFRRLQALGWDTPRIAHRFAYTSEHVANLLKMDEAPEPVKDLVRSNQVSVSMAAKVVRTNGEKAAEVLAGAVEQAHQDGKAKATPKHLKAHLEAHPEAAGPVTPPSGRQLVTEINWKKEGPELLRLVLAVRTATGAARDAAIAAVLDHAAALE